MKTKNIEKVLLLIAVTILLIGLVSAASVNKTSSTKVKKITATPKEINKIQTNKKVKTTSKNPKNTTINDNENKKTITKKNFVKSNETKNNKEESTTRSLEEFQKNYIIDSSVKKVSYYKYNISATVKSLNGSRTDDGYLTILYENFIDAVFFCKTFKLTNGNKASYIYDFENVSLNFDSPVEVYYSKDVITDFEFEISDYDYSKSINYFNIEWVRLDTELNAPKKLDNANDLIIKTTTTLNFEEVSNGKMYLYLNNRLVSTKTPSNGVANFNLGKLKEGTYKVLAKYVTPYNEIKQTSKTIEIFSKKEKMTVQMPSKSYTSSEITINTEVKNGTEKLKVGNIIVKMDGNKIASRYVLGKTISIDYILPLTSGKHKVTVEYHNNGKTIIKKTNTIKLTDSEKLKYTPISSALTDSRKTFKATLTSINGVVNHGRIKITLGKKTIINQAVKNSKVIKRIIMPRTGGIYETTATYIKEGKTIEKITKSIRIKDAETLKFSPVKSSTTNAKKKFTATVTSPNGKVNHGRIKITINGKTIINDIVIDNKVSENIRIPTIAGTYKTTATYIKNGKKIAKITKNIKVTDSEKLTLKLTKNKLYPQSFYKFKAFVTSPNGKVNYGKVKLILDGKSKTVNVKNGEASAKFKLPKYLGVYYLTAYYIKNGKTIQSSEDYIDVDYLYSIYTEKYKKDAIKGEDVTLSASVYNENRKLVKSGKVNFYLDNTKIGSAKIKNGKAILKYKVNKIGNYMLSYTVTINNKIMGYAPGPNIYLFNKLDTSQGSITETLSVSSGYSQVKRGTDTFQTHYQTYYGQDNPGVYIRVWSSNKYNAPNPTTYRLLKARFYYKDNYLDEIITRTATSRWGNSISAPVISDYTPFKVEYSYRKMNKQDKQILGVI